MHLELTGFRLLFCLAAVIHNITPADMNVRGCVVVVIHNVVGDGVGCRTFGPAPGPILLYKGNKGQRGNIRAGHNDLVRVGGPDRLVEGGQLLPDGGWQRHGGSQAALLAESPLEMHPGPPVWEVKLDRQRAKGVVAGIRARLFMYFLVLWPRNSILSTQLRASSTTLIDSSASAAAFSALATVRALTVVEKATDMAFLLAIWFGPRSASKRTDCLSAHSSAALRALPVSTGFGSGVGGGGRGFRPVAARKEGSPMGRTAFSRVASISLKRPVQASARTLTLGSQSSETAMAAICTAILELSIKVDFTLSKSIEGGGGSVSGG